MTTDKPLPKVVEQAYKAGDISTLEDGYYYFFPSHTGGLSAQNLRDIANELDRINAEWDKTVKEDLKA